MPQFNLIIFVLAALASLHTVASLLVQGVFTLDGLDLRPQSQDVASSSGPPFGNDDLTAHAIFIHPRSIEADTQPPDGGSDPSDELVPQYSLTQGEEEDRASARRKAEDERLRQFARESLEKIKAVREAVANAPKKLSDGDATWRAWGTRSDSG